MATRKIKCIQLQMNLILMPALHVIISQNLRLNLLTLLQHVGLAFNRLMMDDDKGNVITRVSTFSLPLSPSTHASIDSNWQPHQPRRRPRPLPFQTSWLPSRCWSRRWWRWRASRGPAASWWIPAGADLGTGGPGARGAWQEVAKDGRTCELGGRKLRGKTTVITGILGTLTTGLKRENVIEKVQ